MARQIIGVILAVIGIILVFIGLGVLPRGSGSANLSANQAEFSHNKRSNNTKPSESKPTRNAKQVYNAPVNSSVETTRRDSLPEVSETKPKPPLPAYSIKQIGEQEWRVIFPAGRWYDTGIPVIACKGVVAQKIDGGMWILKLGGKLNFPDKSSGNSNMLNNFGVGDSNECAQRVDADFKDTLKFKVDDEGEENWVSLDVKIENNTWCHCQNDDPYHIGLHQEAAEWFNQMKARIERR